MKENTYNGWTNYETWCVNLWLDNDQWSQDYVHDLAWSIGKSLYDKAEELKGFVEAMNPLQNEATMFTDLLNGALSMVNWREIVETAMDDIDD